MKVPPAAGARTLMHLVEEHGDVTGRSASDTPSVGVAARHHQSALEAVLAARWPGA